MRLTDEKFAKHVWTYMFQCSLAAVTILIVLLILDTTHQTAIIASIGASAFIIFTGPHEFSAKTRNVLGGYFIGTVVGMGFSLLASTVGRSGWDLVFMLVGAGAVGVSIFIMVVTDTEHPPAAGLALAFVLNEWNFPTVVVVLVAALVLSTMRLLFKNHIRNLI